jgi:hypothetical protein
MRPGSRSALCIAEYCLAATHDVDCTGLSGSGRANSAAHSSAFTQGRREDLGDEYRLRAITKARTSRPQILRKLVSELQGVDGRAKEFVVFVESLAVQRATYESDIGEKQGAEGAIAQSGQPASERSARPIGKHGMGKDPRCAVAEQRDFAYPGQTTRLDAQQQGFVKRRYGESLAQCTCTHGERSAGLQARRQRTAVAQPGEETKTFFAMGLLASPGASVFAAHQRS